MTVEKLNTAVYDRMTAEQQAFRAQLLTMPPAEVLNRAYEYSVREDILISIEEEDILSKAQAQALLESPCPLADVYKDWQKRDSSNHMEDIRDVILCRADEVIRSKTRAAA